MIKLIPIISLVLLSCSSLIAEECSQKKILKNSPDFGIQCQANKTDDVSIDASSFLPISESTIKVSGDVCVQMQQQRLTTQELFYDDKNQIITIENPFNYSDAKQKIKAQNAKIEIAKDKVKMSNLSYSLVESSANGKADEFSINENISHLTGLTYTTCAPDDQQWHVKSEHAELDLENQVGTFRKMSLRFKGVPLLYFPYAKLPLNNQRASGFLIPSIGYSSTNGFDFSIPYYFNIAENMDATITPRLMSKRGMMLGAEFRYLGDKYVGEFYADYLPSDKEDDIDRGYAEFKHRQSFNNQWSMNSRLNHVSDSKYFEDFGNNIYSTSRSYLYSFFDVNGYGDNWLFKARLNDYQIISDSIALNNRPYQTLPSIDYSWFQHNYENSFNYGIDTQWINFYREKSITAHRFDVMPYIEKHFQNSWSRLTPKLAWRHTNWNYENTEYSSITDLKDERSLPIASVDYRISFEKQFTDGSFNSLEPRLFYLYSPFRDQQSIPLFDTHELTYGTNVLFQPNSFSGADRQSDANQLSLALTQRHINKNGVEKWNLTLGQIQYFDNPEVTLNGNYIHRDASPFIAEYNYFYKNWKTTASIHWDADENKTERALLKFQRKGKNNSLFNFAYRFRQGKIEQLDSSVVLPINHKNRFIARWNYSLDSNSTIEAIAGFEFKDCCWATRIVARRHVYNEAGDTKTGIYFELQLDGLGSIGRNPRRLLKQSILGYSEEF
jgi:LPS-assembly protein